MAQEQAALHQRSLKKAVAEATRPDGTAVECFMQKPLEDEPYGILVTGLVIKQVTAGSVTEAAGLCMGDRIWTINGEVPTGAADAVEKMKATAAGKAVAITVCRGARRQSGSHSQAWGWGLEASPRLA